MGLKVRVCSAVDKGEAMEGRFWCVLVGGLLALATSVPAADLGTSQGRQWYPFQEWTLPNESWQGNPFDLRASVEFVHVESGAKRTTEMFYTGKKSWAFRFTGTRRGKWTFATSSADPELHGHTGAIEVAKNPSARAHGFLQKQGSKWSWQGTNEVFVPQLVMWDYLAGGNSPRLFQGKPKLIDAKIAEFLEGHGFNGFHLSVIGGRWFDLDARSDRVEKAMLNPDARTFAALEFFITKTHRAGGMVHLWPWGDHQRSQTPRSLVGGIGGEVDQRLLRYLAARLGPIPGWSMGYGFDLDEWVKAPALRQWRNAFHELSGWSHFLGGRPEGPNHGLDHRVDAAWNKGLDYAGYEHHRPTYGTYRAALMAIPNVPVLSEDRFRVRSNKYPKKDYSEELVRRGLYHSTLAGGVGNIWGVHPKESAGGVFKNKHWIRTYAEFFHREGRFLADMEPALDAAPAEHKTRVLFSAKCRSLIAYREDAKGMKLDLSILESSQRGIAVDTLRPYREIPLGDLKPVGNQLEFPVKSDWVVAIGSFMLEAGAPRLSFSDVGTGPLLNGGHGAMWGDVDDDGRPDLYLPLIIEGTLPDLFLYNRGGGKFVEEGRVRGIADRDGGSHGAAWCDLDNDGDYDLINGTTFDDGSGMQNDLFRNDGKGRFTEVVVPAIESRKEATRAFLSFDMDGDGDLDLFGVTNYRGTADPKGERNEVYRNEGNFRFTAVQEGALVTAPAGQGATDTDFDGMETSTS